MQRFSRFIGAIEIVLGLVMCFLGSKFIFYVLRGLIFAGVNAFIWLMCYNLNLVKFNSGNGQLIIIGLFALVAGVGLAYALGNAAEKYGVAIIAGFSGAAIMFILLANVRISAFEKEIICIVTGILFIYFGKNYNKYVKSAGTATIGSFFCMHGLGQYLGGFPDLMDVAVIDDIEYNTNDINQAAGFIGYIVGMILLACIGTYVQLKHIAPDDEDEDDMMNKDFA
mmetsp:Transcript_11081/g.18555  ORF Transcript_11081/g.18555 Transcript_11081/m.18555 type:complete len:225 (-) Transcript_11081:62-736(-)